MNERLLREKARLQALENLRLSPHEPEERFDRICRIASELLQTPIAYVSLLDDETQFFKSAVGLGDIKETPRADSFCTHTVDGEQSLYVPDATHDDRFRDNPYVQGQPGVRCYLGEPLFSSDGHAVGTFCILDLEPRELAEDQRKTFRELAALAERELNLLGQLHQQRKLTELTSHLATSLDNNQIAQTLLDTLTETLPLDRAAVAVVDGTDLRIVASIGATPSAERLPSDFSGSCFESAAREQLQIPIRYHEQDLGCLWLERLTERSFTSLETELVASFVVQAGLILENRAILANLFEQSRLASIGSLASGVAHELNSPLGAAKLGLESALRNLQKSPDRVESKLRRVNDAVTKASAIVESVLQYAGEGPSVARNSRFDAVLEQTLALLQHDIRSAEVEIEQSTHDPVEVGLSQNDLQTIIHHLLQNALWAVQGEHKIIRLRSEVTDGLLTLLVSDSGVGVPQGMDGRIFDPFFTTREPGSGVGLGLSVSRRLAEQAGGTLALQAGCQETTFKLTLPSA